MDHIAEVRGPLQHCFMVARFVGNEARLYSQQYPTWPLSQEPSGSIGELEAGLLNKEEPKKTLYLVQQRIAVL